MHTNNHITMPIIASYHGVSFGSDCIGDDFDGIYSSLDSILDRMEVDRIKDHPLSIGTLNNISEYFNNNQDKSVEAMVEASVILGYESEIKLILYWFLMMRIVTTSGIINMDDKNPSEFGFSVISQDFIMPAYTGSLDDLSSKKIEAVYVPPTPKVAKETIIKSQTKSANKTHRNDKKARDAFEKEAKEKATIASDEAEAKRIARLRAKAKAVAGKK